MGMLHALWVQLRLTWRLIRDPRVPIWSKAIPVLTLAYILSPLDLIPDVIIGLGQLDDLALLMGAMRLFEAVSPDTVVAEHRAALESGNTPPEIIEGKAKRQ
jgi:uncharacterized membrane protein YkvA (DUF1232 family)